MIKGKRGFQLMNWFVAIGLSVIFVMVVVMFIKLVVIGGFRR